MIRRHTYHSICVLIAGMSLLFSAGAQATGFGAYVEYNHGIGTIDTDFFTFDRDSDGYGVGFALDTNVARDSLFNYRLNLGYNRTDYGFGEKYDGLKLTNTFGFGVWRSRAVRVWMGPSIQLNVDFLKDTPDVIDVIDIGIGGGLAMGVNIHTGDVGSAAVTFGYQYQYVATIFTIGDFVDETFDGGRHLLSVNFTYFFRTRGDRFAARSRN